MHRPATVTRWTRRARGRLCWALPALVLAALALAGALGAAALTHGPRPSASPVHGEKRIAPASRFVDTLDVREFQRGSIHSHSSESDGDTPASVVIQWYRSNGYRFLALTDHNVYFDPRRHRWAESPHFVLVSGEEVSMTAGPDLVHVNALCTSSGVGGGAFATKGAALRSAIDEIGARGGVALVNHPNWRWTLDARDVAGATGAALLEVFSGHPYTRSQGDEAHPSVEELWQSALVQGRAYAPVGVDDAHTYWRASAADGSSNGEPGTGWIGVFGSELSRRAICDALAHGRLYASSGLELRRLRVRGDTMTVWIDDPEALVEFFGSTPEQWLATLPEPDAPGRGYAASYRLRGGERFVRARVTAAGGVQAWTPAFPVADRRTASPVGR